MSDPSATMPASVDADDSASSTYQAGLTEPQIAGLVERYKREIARYEKAAQLVGDRMRRELREAGIKHMVSTRPKHPVDLENKLRKKSREKPEVYRWEALNRDLGSVVTDLGGCRIVVYTSEDEEAVGNMIPRTFAQPAGRSDAVVERRRGVKLAYWATHALVHPYEPVREGEASASPDIAVEGAICEVQVVTVAAHLFNEIEHDIAYKEKDEGLEANEDERQLLDEIRGVARVADRLVTALTAGRLQRKRDANHVIRDAEELRFVLWADAQRPLQGGDVGRLLKLLEQLMAPVTPRAIAELGTVEALIDAGRRQLGEQADDFDEVSLYTVGLFQHFSDEMPQAVRTWRGPRTAMRRAIELAAQSEAEQTEGEEH